MSHTYTNILTHVIFSTKNRASLLDADLKNRLLPYMGGIVRELGGSVLSINGPADHVHLLTTMPATLALADFVRTVKTNSSRWVHESLPSYADFAWHSGYGAFSVSQSACDNVKTYIARQEEHHRTLSFQDEFLAFLTRHGIQYDAKYVWD